MRKTPKRLARAFAGVVAIVATAFVAAPPAFAGATLNVSQTEGLTDGTVVKISGSGFTPNLKNIAIGQCIEGMKGPADCNTGTGAAFKAADAQGNIAEFTLVVKEKFAAFDCTVQQCVFGSQPLPGNETAEVVAANSVFYKLSFGAAQTAPAPTAAPAPQGETLPKTGPGDEIALALGGGLLLMALGGAAMYFTPRTRGGVA